MDNLTQSQIEKKIYEIRGDRVMLDSDLAILYETETKYITRAVRRNVERFPAHFCFQITEIEWENIRCQIGTLQSGRDWKTYLPHVFTEHGVVMLANVLRSEVAVRVSIEIVNAFISLRKMILDYSELERRLNQLEQDYDHRFEVVFQSIRQLMREQKPEPAPFMLDPHRKKIGLFPEKENKPSEN